MVDTLRFIHPTGILSASIDINTLAALSAVYCLWYFHIP